MVIDEFLKIAIERDASDLHFKAGNHPMIRVHGTLTPLTGYPRLTTADCEELSNQMMTDFQRKRLREEFDALKAELAKADKQAALALTDTDNMFGALEFSEKLASAGIQPIVGCALALDFGDETRDPRLAGKVRALPRIVLLGARETGWMP